MLPRNDFMFVCIYVRGIRNNSRLKIIYYVLLVDGSKINSINVSFQLKFMSFKISDPVNYNIE